MASKQFGVRWAWRKDTLGGNVEVGDDRRGGDDVGKHEGKVKAFRLWLMGDGDLRHALKESLASLLRVSTMTRRLTNRGIANLESH